MNVTRLILLLLFIACNSTAEAQILAEQWRIKSFGGKSNTMRVLTKARRTSDPDKAIQEIETALEKISSSKKKSHVKFRFLLSYRLADLYIRTSQYQKAETLLLSRVDEVR